MANHLFAYAHNSEVVDIIDKVEVYRASLKFKADGIMPLNDFALDQPIIQLKDSTFPVVPT